MTELKKFFQSKGVITVITLLVLVLFLYSIGNLINVVLFTFIFAFLMNRFQAYISKYVNRAVKVDPRIILVFMYVVFLSALGLVFYKYLPIITMQIADLITEIQQFLRRPPEEPAVKFVVDSINSLPLDIQNNMTNMKSILGYATGVGHVAFQVLLGIILSLFLLLEKDKIISFTQRFKYSKFSSFFRTLEHFGKKFTNSFGKVIEVQFLIASTNAVLSVLMLWVMDFPQLLGLGAMIFFLGLIPVAGVIISLIPLSMIAYNIGGFTSVLIILVMVAVLHAIEAYILNPKFMSVKTNLPTFFTLAVLLLSEHFFGIWGLIIGIPIFIFLIDMLEVPEHVEEMEDEGIQQQ